MQWMKQAKSNQAKNAEWIIFCRHSHMVPHAIAILDADTFFRMLALIPENKRGEIGGP